VVAGEEMFIGPSQCYDFKHWERVTCGLMSIYV